MESATVLGLSRCMHHLSELKSLPIRSRHLRRGPCQASRLWWVYRMALHSTGARPCDGASYRFCVTDKFGKVTLYSEPYAKHLHIHCGTVYCKSEQDDLLVPLPAPPAIVYSPLQTTQGLQIYECCVAALSQDGNGRFSHLTHDFLLQLRRCGYDAIELLPVQQNNSTHHTFGWGWEDLRALISRAWINGLVVI